MARHADTVYCTLFDAGYLAQALTLHATLLAKSPSARFAFVAMDSASSELLSAMSLERAMVVPYAHIATPELDRARATRSYAEGIWTCKAFALLHLVRAVPEIAWAVYVDADTAFFGDPDLALATTTAHYVLSPHRFHATFLGHAASAGLHNAGYIGMRNTPEGRRAVEWWADRCLESCSAQPTKTTYADQLYLDRMLALFPFGESSPHPGLNAAPWNIERYQVSGDPGRAMLDDAPLLLYHFQSLRILNDWLVDLYAGDRRLSKAVRRLIYGPYLDRLSAAYRMLAQQANSRVFGVRSPLQSPRDWLRLGRGLLRGRHNLVVRRMVE